MSGKLGLSFPSWALPFYPRVLVCPMPKFTPLPGAGRSPGTAAGSLAPWGSPQPRCPGDTAGDERRVMGPASPFPGCPSQTTCPTDPLTTLLTLPREYSPGVLEPRKVAQPGGPAPSGLFAWCPPESETLDKWRGRGGEQHYEEGTRISWAPTMCQVFSQEPAVAYGSGTITTYFIEEKTEAQRHREVSCLAQGHSASDMEA